MVLWRRNWLRRWLGIQDFSVAALGRVTPERIRTHFSSTVFSGATADWVRYLERSREDRYDAPARVVVEWSAAEQRIAFHAEDEASRWLAEAVSSGLALLRRRLASAPSIAGVLEDLLFGNASNGLGPLHIRGSRMLPSEASREVQFNDESNGARETFIVLSAAMLTRVQRQYARHAEEADEQERLGLIWPVLRRVISQLAFPSFPRDRFVEKIDKTARLSVVAIHALYDKRRHRQLVPSRGGQWFQRYISLRDNVPVDHLFEWHPYFRLLNEMGFVLGERDYESYEDDARILVREYLDGRYLRLSIAGVMPETTAIMAPMPYLQQGRNINTPLPQIGKYGILDDEDLEAWGKLEHPLDDMGYTVLRQLGIGEFGRVYEAINRDNPQFPPRVAIKVDRYRKGQKKEAIGAAEVAMDIGRDLAASPHVIRIFDAGKIRKKKYTYHVLQLVDGDTLDNLLDIAGQEHASVRAPIAGHLTERDAQIEFARAMRGSPGEAWRRRQVSLPFVEPLSLTETMDLLTSLLLWLEEIHGLGYAINDLKNGNLMISRRGQLKGIDMDSYSRIRAPHDKTTDFFFLAVSILFLLFNCSAQRLDGGAIRRIDLRNRDDLATLFRLQWSFDQIDLETSRGFYEEMIALWVDLISRCRDLTYARDPNCFGRDIDRLIALRREAAEEEIVLD